MIGRVLGTAGWLAFFAWLASGALVLVAWIGLALAVTGCAVLGTSTPAERAAQALEAVDRANQAAELACDVYAAGVVARRVKPDPEITGRCNARILDRE